MSKDNQQEILATTVEDWELGWLAGIIECDGSVTLSCYIRNEKHCKPKIGTELKVYNTDGGIIAKVVDILERLGLSHHISERQQIPMDMRNGKSYGDITKVMLSVSVKRLDDAYKLGLFLYPFMSGEKKDRLSLIIKYLRGRLTKIEEAGGNKRTPLAKDDCEVVVDFYKKFVKRKGHNRHLVEAILNDFT